MSRPLMTVIAALAFASAVCAQTLPPDRIAFYDSVTASDRPLKEAEQQAFLAELEQLLAPYPIAAVLYGGPFGNATWSMTFVPDAEGEPQISFMVYSAPRSAEASQVSEWNVTSGGVLGLSGTIEPVTVTSELPTTQPASGSAQPSTEAPGPSTGELDHVVLFSASTFGGTKPSDGQIAVAQRHGPLSMSMVLAGSVGELVVSFRDRQPLTEKPYRYYRTIQVQYVDRPDALEYRRESAEGPWRVRRTGKLRVDLQPALNALERSHY